MAREIFKGLRLLVSNTSRPMRARESKPVTRSGNRRVRPKAEEHFSDKRVTSRQNESLRVTSSQNLFRKLS